jgi:uncharacterized protein (DUF1697 family)
MVRTRAELAEVVERDPLGDVADNGSRYRVGFLAKAVPARVVRELQAAAVEPERVAVAGREIYSWHPGGFQRSPLVRQLADGRLGVASTARNWNTVTKLLALADEN